MHLYAGYFERSWFIILKEYCRLLVRYFWDFLCLIIFFFCWLLKSLLNSFADICCNRVCDFNVELDVDGNHTMKCLFIPLTNFGAILQVALKTLIVIHRLLRDGDPTFREELLNFSQKAHILRLSNFKDDSSPIGQWYSTSLTVLLGQVNAVKLMFFYSFASVPAWDCSAWVRTYALYLEERLECFRVLKYDVEAERLTRPGQGPEKVSLL